LIYLKFVFIYDFDLFRIFIILEFFYMGFEFIVYLFINFIYLIFLL